MENLRKYGGRLAGHKVAVVGGTHGNERVGVDVLMLLIASLHHRELVVEAGELTLLIGNPAAVEAGTRSGPDGHDLNRLFTRVVKMGAGETLTHHRAREVMRALGEVDVVVDIHQTNLPTAGSFITTPTLPMPEQALALRAFSAQALITDPYCVFGAGKPCTIEEFVGRVTGRLGVCYEVAQVGDNSVEQVFHEIVNFLRIYRVLGGAPRPLNDPPTIYQLTERLALDWRGFTWCATPYNLQWVGRKEILGYRTSRPLAELLRGDDRTGVYVDAEPVRASQDGILVYPKTQDLQRKEGVIAYLAKRV